MLLSDFNCCQITGITHEHKSEWHGSLGSHPSTNLPSSGDTIGNKIPGFWLSVNMVTFHNCLKNCGFTYPVGVKITATE